MSDTPPHSSRLKHCVVVITGASSGFGRGAALEFARHGADVVMASRRGDLIDQLSEQLDEYGVRSLAVETDVSDARAVEHLAECAIEAFGHIDIWLNSAGCGAIGPFERVPLADHANVIATDLLGTMYGSYFAYRHFREQGHGTLINIAADLCPDTAAYHSSYAAAKHGVIGLSDSLRREIAQDITFKDRIHVCVVMPTAHKTPFYDNAANYSGHAASPGMLDGPDEVVDAIIDLAISPRDELVVGKTSRAARESSHPRYSRVAGAALAGGTRH